MRWVPGQCALFDIVNYNTQIDIEGGGTAWLCAFRINLKKKKHLIYKINHENMTSLFQYCHAMQEKSKQKTHTLRYTHLDKMRIEIRGMVCFTHYELILLSVHRSQGLHGLRFEMSTPQALRTLTTLGVIAAVNGTRMKMRLL